MLGLYTHSEHFELVHHQVLVPAEVMFQEALSGFLYFIGLLQQAIDPCIYPQLLPVKSVDRQQYLGKWYFKAAVSHTEADIRQFRALDNSLFIMEETANDTLLLTGHMRIGDACMKQTWTYHLQPERDDLALEGRPQRKNLLWSGKWANCLDCIVFQETEPPLNETGTVDSLHRHMLYARHSDVKDDLVTAFLKNAACHKMQASVRPPQKKEFCA